MKEISIILEPDVDGTLHLPLPPELRKGKVEVKATLRQAGEEASLGEGAGLLKAGCLKGFWISPDFDEPLEDFREFMQ